MSTHHFGRFPSQVLVRFASLALASALVFASGVARADEAPPVDPEEQQPESEKDEPKWGEPKKEEEPEDRRVYLSISPLHLIARTVELTGEVRAHRKIGVAGIVGFGRPQVDGSSASYTAFELGGQFIGYPVGHFDHGMQLGVEALFVGVSGEDSTTRTRIDANAQGVGVGPIVGYKLATDVGFSFNVQAGLAYFAATARAEGGGEQATASTSAFIPILNLNAGWSF